MRVWVCLVRRGRSVILYGELLGFCWLEQLVATRHYATYLAIAHMSYS